MDIRFALLAVSLFVSQCHQPETDLTPTELTIKFVDELGPQLVGTWQIRQAQVSHKHLVPVYYSTGITKDTLLQDVATLNLWPSSEKQIDGRVLELEGTLQFRAHEYPINAKLWPRQNDPRVKGTLFLDFAYKGPGTILIPQEVDYLQSIGLIGDNFSVETVLGEPTMTWRGLNRAIVAASFYRK